MLDRFETFSTTIAMINRCVQKIKTREMTSIGMKGAHVMCLYTLGKESGGLTASQLCIKCGEDKAAISRTIKELIKLKYIKHISSTGKRAYRTKLILTEKGKEALIFVEDRVNKALEVIGGNLKDDERKAFYSSLKLIAANLKQYVGKSGANA